MTALHRRRGGGTLTSAMPHLPGLEPPAEPVVVDRALPSRPEPVGAPTRSVEPEPHVDTAAHVAPEPHDAPEPHVEPEQHVGTDVLDAPAPFSVEVTRSARRRRTVGAHLVGSVLRIAIPSWMSAAEEAHWVEEMSGRFRRKMATDRIELADRAALLARRHDLQRPRDIRWADDMTTRWGSCTPATGTVRISTRIAPFPDWVVDYVIVHELAHLDVAGHDERFWRIVHRFSKAERAIGYLMAKSGEDD